MKNKEEQIQEMAKDLEEAKSYTLGTIGSLNNGFGGWYGTYMYDKGYRKASDVIDEFVERVKERALQSCHKIINCYEVTRIKTEIDELADDMRQRWRSEQNKRQSFVDNYVNFINDYAVLQEYAKSLTTLPPQGDEAKSMVKQEINDLCQTWCRSRARRR